MDPLSNVLGGRLRQLSLLVKLAWGWVLGFGVKGFRALGFIEFFGVKGFRALGFIEIV